jgi:hypothetical protein
MTGSVDNTRSDTATDMQRAHIFEELIHKFM